MSARLFWRAEGHVHRMRKGEIVQWVAGPELRERWRMAALAPISREHAGLWIEDGDAWIAPPSPEFFLRASLWLCRCAFIANLVLAENILLPVLHHGDARTIERAEARLRELAPEFGLDERDLRTRTGGIEDLGVRARAETLRAIVCGADFWVAEEPFLDLRAPDRRMLGRCFARAACAFGLGVLLIGEGPFPEWVPEIASTIRSEEAIA